MPVVLGVLAAGPLLLAACSFSPASKRVDPATLPAPQGEPFPNTHASVPTAIPVVVTLDPHQHWTAQVLLPPGFLQLASHRQQAWLDAALTQASVRLRQRLEARTAARLDSSAWRMPPLARRWLARLQWRPQPVTVPVQVVRRRQQPDGHTVLLVEIDRVAMAEGLAQRVALIDRRLRPFRFFSDTDPADVQLNRLLPAWLLLLERARATVMLNLLAPGRPETKRDRLAQQLLTHVHRLFRRLEAGERDEGAFRSG